MNAQDDELAKLIIEPYLRRELGPGNFVSIDALRKAFLSKEKTLPEFTRGMKVLLDGRILKRVNDHELGLGTQGEGYCRQHWPEIDPPR